MKMSDRIKQLRLEKNMTQEELAQALGLQKSAIAKYENGRVENIKRSVIAKMSQVLETTPSYLIGWDEENVIETKKENDSSERLMAYQRKLSVPVLGRVAAGIPYHMMEEILDYEEIDPKLAATGEYFALRIKGDSMEPRICNGDVVIVKVQSDAETGDTVIATVNGDDATCKRLKKYNDSIVLISNNPTYEPMVYDQKDIDEKPVTIIGKVVELRGKF